MLKLKNNTQIQLACHMKYFQLSKIKKNFMQGPKNYELKLKVFDSYLDIE